MISAIASYYLPSKDPERYYQNHDSALNAFNQALAVLKERRIDISLLQDKEKGKNIIKDLQEQLARLEEINEIYEQDIRNNQKEINELRKFQKELDIYSTLERFIHRDLCDIWDGKLDYIDKRDQLTDDNKGMYCHEEYEVVYQKLNKIMSEYF